MQTSAERGSDMASTRRPSDRDLLARFLASRDESAFAEIVSRYSRLVMSVALHTLRDPHAAEDAFQAAFLVLARSARRIRNRDSLASWLHGTTFRVSHRLLRSRLRRKEQDLPDVELPAPIWANPERPDEQAALDEELARLSEGLRGPLVLHYLEGRSVPEIAAELKMTQSAVEGRLKRGKKTLRKRLLKRGVLLSSAVFGAGLTIPAEAGVAGALVTATVAACLKTAATTSLPPIAATTIQQIATQEIAAMTRIALLKAALICGGVAGTLGLAGAGANGTLGIAWAQRGEGVASTDANSAELDTADLGLSSTGVIQTALAQVPDQSPNVAIEGTDGTFLSADALQIDGFELTQARGRSTDAVAEAPTVRGHAREILNATVRVDVADKPLDSLLKEWSTNHNVPIHVDGRDQKQMADLIKTPVTVNTSGLKLGSVLQAVLAELGLEHRVEEDGIHISSQATAQSQPDVKVINAEGAIKTPSIRAHVEQSLKSPAEIRFTGQTLEEALHFIAAHYKIPVVAEHGAMQVAGIDYQNDEVRGGVKGVPLEEALEILLGSVKGRRLSFRVEEDGLHVTPRQERGRSGWSTLVKDGRPLDAAAAADPSVLSQAPPGTTADPFGGADGAQAFRGMQGQSTAAPYAGAGMEAGSVSGMGMGSLAGVGGYGAMSGMMAGVAAPPRPKAVDDLLKSADKTQAKALRDYLSQLERRSSAARGTGTPASAEATEVREFRPQNPREDLIRKALETTIDCQFTGQTLGEVMNFFAAQYNMVTRLDTASLTEAGVGPDQEITLVVSGIKLRSALNLMLKDVGGVELDYVIDNDVMTITTKEKADTILQTVVYDVSALGTIDPLQVQAILERTVEPASWEASGGKGTIVPVDNSVVVTTSRRLQDKTAEILKTLQQSKAPKP